MTIAGGIGHTLPYLINDFVMATVAVRFVFPAVSAEGQAFWVIRTAPISLRDFLWSKFWTGLVPVLVLTEVLTMSANQLLGVDPFLKLVSAVAIALLSVALVGVATGLGARYPRFTADNPSQVAGSYGGVAFMIVAVLLANRARPPQRLRDLLFPLGVLVGLVCGLIMIQPDLGTTLAVMIMVFAVLVAAGVLVVILATPQPPSADPGGDPS